MQQEFAALDFDPVYVSSGSWPCQNALLQTLGRGGVAMRAAFSGFDYARMAAISGWMPMMFITRVRL